MAETKVSSQVLRISKFSSHRGLCGCTSKPEGLFITKKSLSSKIIKSFSLIVFFISGGVISIISPSSKGQEAFFCLPLTKTAPLFIRF